jgi:hypothetical protein
VSTSTTSVVLTSLSTSSLSTLFALARNRHATRQWRSVRFVQFFAVKLQDDIDSLNVCVSFVDVMKNYDWDLGAHKMSIIGDCFSASYRKMH